MLKAFYDVIPREKIKKVQMDFALGNGIYGELEGDVALTEELLDRVKEEMHVLVERKLPIVKRSVNTDEAVELFGRHGMHDKEQLFMYRRGVQGQYLQHWKNLRIIFTDTWCRIQGM